MTVGLNDIMVVVVADLLCKDLYNIFKEFVLLDLISIYNSSEGLPNAHTSVS
jgi:hypothetical protein